MGFAIGGCPMSLKKKIFFCFENSFFSFSYMANACVRESVKTQDMGHDMWAFM